VLSIAYNKSKIQRLDVRQQAAVEARERGWCGLAVHHAAAHGLILQHSLHLGWLRRYSHLYAQDSTEWPTISLLLPATPKRIASS
jgi:hypothetical protein